MISTILVVDNPARWKLEIDHLHIVSARDYLGGEDTTYPGHENSCRVINLCRSYAYQRNGYYVSLLAEARGHRPVPSVSTLQSIRYRSIIRSISMELDELIQKSLRSLQGDRFTLSIYFSSNLSPKYDRLSRALYNLFPVPLLRAHFRKVNNQWTIGHISPISLSDVPESHMPSVSQFAKSFFGKRSHQRRKLSTRFHLAILVNPQDPTPPSDQGAMTQFIEAAESRHVAARVIHPEDYGRLNEFDGLFIRETTAVNHHTYRFARRAESEGLSVIDDPISIVRCANKVYQAESFRKKAIPSPETIILHRGNKDQVIPRLGLPCVLKQPDSSFSRGVEKVEDESEFHSVVDALLEKSELLIAQQYLRTDYDWRIGILDGKPLYACRYFMARDHWQIYNHKFNQGNLDDYAGNYETLPLHKVPDRVLRTATRAGSIVGKGLYGIDIKWIRQRPYVIEVNDNPSLDFGVEDAVLGAELYQRIIDFMIRQMEHLITSRSNGIA
jgi:glutathione synthase/RimK-type ligase-like ATP-grasp enzyme